MTIFIEISNKSITFSMKGNLNFEVFCNINPHHYSIKKHMQRSFAIKWENGRNQKYDSLNWTESQLFQFLF